MRDYEGVSKVTSSYILFDKLYSTYNNTKWWQVELMLMPQINIFLLVGKMKYILLFKFKEASKPNFHQPPNNFVPFLPTNL